MKPIPLESVVMAVGGLVLAGLSAEQALRGKYDNAAGLGTMSTLYFATSIACHKLYHYVKEIKHPDYWINKKIATAASAIENMERTYL